MASEICFFKLKPESNLSDASSPTGKVWQSIVGGFSKVPGVQATYYGLGVEDKTLMNIVIDWDSLDAYNTWKTTESYPAIMKELISLVDAGSQRVFHVHWNVHPPTAATSAPVTEFVIFHHSSDISDAEKAEFEKNAIHFGDVIKAEAKGSTGSVGGWVTTPLEHEGQKSAAYIGLLGWDSVESHLAYTQTDQYKELITGIRGGLIGRELHHATLDQFGT